MNEESKYMYYMLRDIAKNQMKEANSFKKLMMMIQKPVLEEQKPEERRQKKV